MRVERFKRDLSGIFFTRKGEDIWNEPSKEVVEVGTMVVYNRYLNKYLDGNGLEGYGAGKWN